MDVSRIIVSEDLDLHYSEDLDERYVYHLSINMLNDIRLADYRLLAELAHEGAFAIRYLQALIPSLARLAPGTNNDIPLFDSQGNLQRLPRVLPTGALHPYEMRQVVDHVVLKPGTNRSDYTWRLVASLFITTEQ